MQWPTAALPSPSHTSGVNTTGHELSICALPQHSILLQCWHSERIRSSSGARSTASTDHARLAAVGATARLPRIRVFLQFCNLSRICSRICHDVLIRCLPPRARERRPGRLERVTTTADGTYRASYAHCMPSNARTPLVPRVHMPYGAYTSPTW